MEKEIFEELVVNARAAATHSRGEVTENVRELRVQPPKHVDVKQVREKLGMTQTAFAHTFGFSLRTLSSWERHERRPEAAARVLINTIARFPEAVLDANSPA